MACHNCGGCGAARPEPLNEIENQLLDQLAQNAFLPLCRLLLRSPESKELSFVMSAPVYLPDAAASKETVRAYGAALLSLQKRRYITLDYNVPLSGFDYDAWRRSEYYQGFAFSMEAPGVEPFLEPGSAALTLQGQEALDGTE
ncbi:MAG: hypothetical protein MJ077_04060 [Oscillospiraceae bacterium]|nr:hypothetical protein [Oscillospiraceae bacterium]